MHGHCHTIFTYQVPLADHSCSVAQSLQAFGNGRLIQRKALRKEIEVKNLSLAIEWFMIKEIV